jgi:PAS domain S-box-containing protein
MSKPRFTLPAPATDIQVVGLRADADTHSVRQAYDELMHKYEALETSERRYRSLFNSIDSGFCVIEVLIDQAGSVTDYRFVEVNSAFEAQTGLKDAIGKSMRALAPGHEQHWFDIYGRVAASGQPVRFQNRAVALNRWYDAYAFPVGPPTDRTVGILFTDITARKRAEEVLRDREQQLRFVTDHLPVLIVHCDSETRFKFVNRAYAERFGIDPEHVAGRTIIDVIGPSAYEVIRKHVEAALAGERIEFEELIPYEKIGRRWMHGVYIPEKSPDGRVVGFIAVIQDVTKRKDAEQALAESESRFRAVMEQSPFSVQIFTPDGRTVRVNRAWEVLWGITLADLSDYNILYDPQLEARGIAPYIRKAFAGQPVEIPAVQYDPNQTLPNRTRNRDPVRWVSAVAYPLHDETGHVREVVLVHQDITERKHAEDALAKTQQELKDYALNLEKTVAERTAKLRETVQELEASPTRSPTTCAPLSEPCVASPRFSKKNTPCVSTQSPWATSAASPVRPCAWINSSSIFLITARSSVPSCASPRSISTSWSAKSSPPTRNSTRPAPT